MSFQKEVKIRDDAFVRMRTMNGLVEFQYLEKRNTECPILVLNEKQYLVKATGEVKDFDTSTENRADSYKSLRRTFKTLRYLINANFCSASNELFVTLTYAKDRPCVDSEGAKVFLRDFKVFMKKIRKKYGQVEFINVVEPHSDGHIHAHVLMKFIDYDSIFIANSELATIWGKGFVKVTNLKNVDNVGAYLSAYLSDVELTQDSIYDCLNANETIKIKNACGKKFIKGGRLKYYVKGFRIYRKSKGIKEPIFFDGKYSELKKRAGITCQKPCYSKSYQFATKDFSNTIIYEHFNLR